MIKAEYREENLEQLADFFEFAPVGMVLLDANGRVLRANVAAVEVLRYFDARAEAAGIPFVKLFVEPEVGRKALETVSAGGTVLHLKTKLRARGGEEVEVLLDGNARTDGGALKATRWFLRPGMVKKELPSARAVAATDDVAVTLSRMSPEERDRCFDELNDFFDNAPVGVHFVGLNGIMMRANRAEVQLLGFAEEPSGYIGRHVREIHHETAVVETLLERLVAGTPVIAHEAYLKRRDGTLEAVHIYSGLRLKGGKFQNTRCFLFKNPSPRRPPTESHVPGFSWPRSDAS